MATFFGEVILPSSRAFFDDIDDSDCETDDCETSVSRDSIQVCIKDHSSLDTTFHTIVVSDGALARDFVSNYLGDVREQVAEFTVSPDQELHDETEMIYSKKLSAKPISVAAVHKINKNVLYLDTSKFLKLTDCNLITLQIESWLEKCKEVIIFASRPLNDYKCDRYESMPQTFVRSLATSCCSLPSTCSPLEQPNFISGIAASVMSWSEVQKKKCLLHVCYTDALFSDSATLAPFLKCISHSYLSNLVKKTPELIKHNNPVHLNIMYQ